MATPPNFVYVLCDDFWKLGGDEAAVPQTVSLLADEGARFDNFFVSSPKCTPSRSAWLTGRYYHNLRPGGSTSGRGLNTSSLFDQDALFPLLHRHGYRTGIFGKIHNDQSRWLCRGNNHTAPFTHIETECNPCGGYYEQSWVRKEDDADVTHTFTMPTASYGRAYSEAEYGNRSIAWIRRVASQGQPFFAYVGTTGPHLGVVPAPWHRERTESLNVTAPRTPNFNFGASDHFPLLSSAPLLDAAALEYVDRHMRDRWGTLFSVDDLVAGLVGVLQELHLMESTYTLFSSDHGYHLGQFRIPDEKMLPYETDLRIPFFIRGPGIKPGRVLTPLCANIDVAPTLLELAGIPVPPLMDGKSLVRLVRGDTEPNWRTSFMSEFAEGGVQQWATNGMWKLQPASPLPVLPARWMNATDIDGVDGVSPCPVANSSNPQECQAACDAAERCIGWTHHHNPDHLPVPGWRCCQKTAVFGLKVSDGTTTSGLKDPRKPIAGSGDAVVYPPARPAVGGAEYIYDTPFNQWRALRVLNATDNIVYIEWDPEYVFVNVSFHEFYDLAADPWQKHNAWNDQPAWRQEQLRSDIATIYECRGLRTVPSNCP